MAEVLLTDQRQVGELAVLAAAQLPLSHPYYSDHVQELARYDVLLLLEACRQAGIAGGHLLGLPAETIMLVGSFGIRIEDTTILLMSDHPARMLIDSKFAATRVRGDQVRAGEVSQSFSIDGRPAGVHHMAVTFLTAREHAALRRMQRHTTPPVTASLPDPPATDQVAPAAVRRVHPLNVVLSAVSWTCENVSASVTPRFGNHVLFDHTYDHIPALVLTEAARQLAVLSFGEMTSDALLAGVDAEFGRHAELDQPLRAVTEGRARPPAEITVTFAQKPPGLADGRSLDTVARVALTFGKSEG